MTKSDVSTLPTVEGFKRRADAERALARLCDLPKGTNLTVTAIREEGQTSHETAQKLFAHIVGQGHRCSPDKMLKGNPKSMRSVWVDPPEAEPPPAPVPLFIEPLLPRPALIRRTVWALLDKRRFG
jgi:hypothetical protein